MHERLQQASFNTNVWYERRRGEFRNLPEGVRSVSNELFGELYLLFHLNESIQQVLDIALKGKKIIFNNETLYKTIFNEGTDFDDMLTAFLVFNLIFSNIDQNHQPLTRYVSYELSHITTYFPYELSLIKNLLKRYVKEKYNVPEEGFNGKIQEACKNNQPFIFKSFLYINHFIDRQIGQDNNRKFAKTVYYNSIKNNLNLENISTEYIDNFNTTTLYSSHSLK